MRYYRSACEFDDTRVHGDYSVIGSEFCDFLATVLTWRLIKAFTEYHNGAFYWGGGAFCKNIRKHPP